MRWLKDKITGFFFYRRIEEMLTMINEPNQTKCFNILLENKKLFQAVQGSTHNHQAWPGGYYDHVQEIMNITIVLYTVLNFLRTLPFSLSDALLIVFLHDIEKPWKYEFGSDGHLRHIDSLKTKQAQHEFRTKKLREYGLMLTPDQENAMKYVEGEFDDYSNRQRTMKPLAALCHLADVISARIWYNHPMEKDDPWRVCERHRN